MTAVGAGRPVWCGLVQCGVVLAGFRTGAVQCSGQCRCEQCGFQASVGAVFILNGMIFSFLDEKRVFEGVV